MRSPFHSITSWFERVLVSLQEAVEVLAGILETIRALLMTIERFESRESTQAPPPNTARIDAQDARIDDLTLAVKEGVNNVQRSERRVRAIVASARKELADQGYSHAGVDAESDQLRDIDGDGSDQEELPTVPEDLEGPSQAQHSIIPGVSVRQMQLARARRR